MSEPCSSTLSHVKEAWTVRGCCINAISRIYIRFHSAAVLMFLNQNSRAAHLLMSLKKTNLLTIGGVNSVLLTVKITLQASTLKVGMAFSRLIPVFESCDRIINTHTNTHTCTWAGPTQQRQYPVVDTRQMTETLRAQAAMMRRD